MRRGVESSLMKLGERVGEMKRRARLRVIANDCCGGGVTAVRSETILQSYARASLRNRVVTLGYAPSPGKLNLNIWR